MKLNKVETSYINECKGNLFEFLVAQFLAQRWGTEEDFLLGISNQYRHQLKLYEETLRQLTPALQKGLPVISRQMASALFDYLGQLPHNFSEMQIRLLGKSDSEEKKSIWRETDLVFYQMDSMKQTVIDKFYVSLKLCKDHSFVNTKSAGINSFVSKYFDKLNPHAQIYQHDLNLVVHESFLSMGIALYQLAQISHGDEFALDFNGTFHKKWSEYYSDRPGDLPPQMADVVYAHYHRLALKIHDIFTQLKKHSAEKFYISLFALCGFGENKIIQAKCFHHGHRVTSIDIKKMADFFGENSEGIEIGQVTPGRGYFEISFPKNILQIRVKPMNKFTAQSYKINCSIKSSEANSGNVESE